MTTPNFGGSKPKMPTKKKVLIGGIAAVGTIAAVLYYKRSSANSAAANQSSALDTSNTADTGIDPATGIPYADEYGGMSGAYGTTPGILGSYDPLTGQYTPGYGTTGQVSTIASNAEWAQAAEQFLVAQGYDPATTSAALGLYLAGLPLTQDQYDIVQAAIGFEGQPPNGAPTPVLAGGGGTGQGGGGTTPPTKTPPPTPPTTSGLTVSVPNVINQRRVAARAIITAKGLKYRPSDPQNNNLPGYISSQSPSAGSKVKLGSTVTVTVTQGNPPRG